MINTVSTSAVDVSPDSEDWVPAWWGNEDDNAEEGKKFAKWTRKMRPVDD